MTIIARSLPYVELLHNQFICHRCGIQYKSDRGAHDSTLGTYCCDCRPFARAYGWAPKLKPRGMAKRRVEEMHARRTG